MFGKCIAPVLAALLLAGCAGDGAATNIDVADYDSNGLYDGYYGPFHGGYWGSDGYFWYLDANHDWHRDDAGHFRHNSMLGNGL